MLALEPFRKGREYSLNPQWVLDNVEPWDHPECCCYSSGGDDHRELFCDASSTRGRWDALLACKRNDYNYEDIVKSLRKFGVLACPTLKVNGDGSIYEWGDGHHRLAAMLDLGYESIPVRAEDAYDTYRVLRMDSGGHWDEWELTLPDGTPLYEALLAN